VLNYPPVGVLIPTFQRHEIVTRTVILLRRHLRYSGRLLIFVAEDGPELPALDVFDVQVSQGPQRGLGGNLNALWQAQDYAICLQMDDDYWLVGELDLDPHVQTLLREPQAGIVRLAGLAGHSYRAELRGAYWWLDWQSPELYLASNRAHLKHRRWQQAFSPYPESVSLAQTEIGYCAQCKALAQTPGDWPQVLAPLDVATESLWWHAGGSWQNRGY
jgi:hypothetical protein